MKHKHRDIIVAWAYGEQIQFYRQFDGKWIDIDDSPRWTSSTQYRIKPKEEFLKYKVALFKSIFTGEFSVEAYSPKKYEEIESAPAFVMWLGEEQTVNVGWLQK